MLQKQLFLAISLILVITTTQSVWSDYVSDFDGIEISEKLEKDVEEKSEKESEDKIDDGDDFVHSLSHVVAPLSSGYLKLGSATLVPTSLLPRKLYLIHSQLKVHC